MSAGDQKKEIEHIDNDLAKARERRTKAEDKGKTADPDGYKEVIVSRLLELGSFGKVRRAMLNGRATIAVDYVGDPKGSR